MAYDSIQKGDRVLIIDDWTETGAPLAAAVERVEIVGADIAGVAELNADEKAQSRCAAKGHRLHSILSCGA